MNPARERLITVVTLAGLTAAFVAAVHLPGRSAEAALKDEEARLEAEISRGTELLDRFQATRQRLNRRAEYLDGSEESVAKPDDVLARVSQAAKASGIALLRLEPEPVAPRASYAKHPFRLEFRGGLAPLTLFLGNLEQDPRIYAVEELELTRAAGESNGAILEGTLRFTTFVAHDGSSGSAEENGSTAAP